jgi:hypothetical protein
MKSSYAAGYLDAKDNKLELSPEHIIKRKDQIIKGSIDRANTALNIDKSQG